MTPATMFRAVMGAIATQEFAIAAALVTQATTVMIRTALEIKVVMAPTANALLPESVPVNPAGRILIAACIHALT